MSEISLRVTQRVLDYAQGANARARQIAFAGASADIAPKLATITGSQPLSILLGGLITLVAADNSAIWRTHNREAAADFDALYDLLARYPSTPMRFVCEILDTRPS